MFVSKFFEAMLEALDDLIERLPAVGVPADRRTDPPGCDGFVAYRASMLEIAQRLEVAAVEAAEVTDDDELDELDRKELGRIERIARPVIADLRRVLPPPYARQWHAAVLEQHSLVLRYLDSAQVHGYQEDLDEFLAQMQTAGEAAVTAARVGGAICPFLPDLARECLLALPFLHVDPDYNPRAWRQPDTNFGPL